MKYFAYGSNMSIARLKERVPGARSLGCHTLKEHDLRFHKLSKDGSGKCDAFFTGKAEDNIYGVLFEIDPAEKKTLDRVEGLGYGYNEKDVTVVSQDCDFCSATTYIATNIDECVKPYSWYVNHVVVGAKEASLPSEYIQIKIYTVDSVEDKDKERDAIQRAVHS